jgi:tRNA-specific 2-thiouridylase
MHKTVKINMNHCSSGNNPDSHTTNPGEKKIRALGLCSGGLDSILAGLVLRRQGVEVVWISFETPFFNAEKARAASVQTGIELIVRDITDRYLPMLADPPAGYGRFVNPCMDCHALMFRIAGEMMAGIGADFLFSGEVVGQRPMSQVKSSLRYVEKRSGFDGLILRPLSARKLPVTPMEEQGLVDRQQLCDFSGRSRKPQMAMAEFFGITDYPAPAGGCLLTGAVFGGRLKDLMAHRDRLTRRELELLKYGRHLRLEPGARLVVGRNKDENEQIARLYDPDADTRIRLHRMAGPLGLVVHDSAPSATEQAAAICAGYSKAPRNQPVETEVTPPGQQARVIPVIPVDPEFTSQWSILPCR